jgi:hypothetical protein
MPIVSTLPGVDGDPQFRAHAIGGGHQHRVVIARSLEVEKRAEPAEPRHHPGPCCRGGSGLDPVHQRIARVDIHAALGIGQTR